MPNRGLVLRPGIEGNFHTNIRAIWRRNIIFVVLSDLVEVIFVQLSHEASEVAMLEVLGQDMLGKLLVLHPMLLTCCEISLREFRTSRTTKLSPPSPQRTIDSYDGSSSILR
jgi:hypothetical protein